jgi:hypothetical protein
MSMFRFSSSVHLHTYHVIEKSSFYTTHKSSVSTGFTEQIMPILRILCYNGSLVIWSVIRLTTKKFKPLTFSMSGFTLSYTANIFIRMILYDFCVSPEAIVFLFQLVVPTRPAYNISARNEYKISFPSVPRYSSVGIATGYGLDDQGGGSSSPGGVKNFHFSISSRPAQGSTQPPIKWVPGLYPGSKAAGAWSWPLTSN